MAPYLAKYDDDIQQRTRWWNSYPSTGYNERTKAGKTFDEYLTNAFLPSNCLARSASAISLTFVREPVDRTFKPLRKYHSFSDLSPSHALPYHLRVPERFVSQHRVVKPQFDQWYFSTYSPFYFHDTHTYAYGLRKRDPPRIRYGRTWYHPGLLDRYVTWPGVKSYVKGSQNYLDNYVSDRLRFDVDYVRYVHSSYDRKPDDRYLRYMKGEPDTFMNIPAGLPRYPPAWHRHRIYRLNNKVIY